MEKDRKANSKGIHRERERGRERHLLSSFRVTNKTYQFKAYITDLTDIVHCKTIQK